MNCKETDKPIIYYRFGKSKVFSQISIDKGSIDVRVNRIWVPDPENPAKCWRFFGKSLCPNTVTDTEYFAYGISPSWFITDSRDCPHKGKLAQPYIDGRRVMSWWEEGSKAGHQGLEEAPNNACRAGKLVCELEVLRRGSSIFKKQGECPCVFEVKCSAGDCPEGHLKCPCNRPPGYCCIPCSEVSSQLSGIKGALR